MAIVVTLTSTQVPAVQHASAFTSAAAGLPPTAQSYSAGDSSGVTSKLDENAARLDLAFRYGGTGGVYAVAYGLAISVTGLVATIGTGHALIEGLVEIAAPLSANLANGVNNYIWLSQAKTLTVTTTTTPPSGKVCYLGMVVGGATDVDVSGVLFVQGFALIRQTADGGAPADAPPAGIALYTVTAGGTYLWQGAAHVPLGGAAGVAYFGALAHSSGDPTTHDSWTAGSRTGVHITPDDRSDIAANASAAASAQSTANTALANAATAQSTANAANTAAAAAVQTTDPRLSDSRNPLAHATSHGSGGSDPISIQSSQVADFATRVMAIIAANLLGSSHISVAYNSATQQITLTYVP